MDLHIVETQPLTVLAATHNNSSYFVAGGHDITEYVHMVMASSGGNDITENEIQDAVNLFIQKNNDWLPKLFVPQFELTLLNSDDTPLADLAIMISDLFHIGLSDSYDICYEIDAKGSYVIGTYTNEYAMTFGRMIDMYAEVMQAPVLYDISEVDTYEKNYNLLVNLVRLDDPEV